LKGCLVVNTEGRMVWWLFGAFGFLLARVIWLYIVAWEDGDVLVRRENGEPRSGI
jgi:hypothetical protein